MAATGAGEGKKAAAGSSLHSKTLLKSEQLYQYILESTVFPREPDCLRELRVATTTHPMACMAASPDQVQLFGLLIEMLGARNAIEVGVFTGYSLLATALRPCRACMAASPDQVQLFGLLIEMLGARNAIEVGVFTGYSLLATALALPDDGKVVAIDVSRESYDMIGSPVVEKAGMAHKIDFRVGLALPVLDQLVAEDGSSGKFDFAFVDADKANFHHYHERLLRLVRVGGLIAYDNTLWGGSVAAPDDEALSERDRELARIAREFNAALTGDRRVQVCQLAISDGIMLCRRVA